MNDLESRIAATLHQAAARDDLPESDLADVFVRTRRRSTARRAVGAIVAVALLTAGGLVFVGSDHSSNRRIKAGGSPSSTVVPSVSAARPVLDGCKTNRAIEGVSVGGSASPKANPPVAEEVFADPARGISGPLVIFERGSGTLLRTGDGAAGGAKIANGQVNGRDADIEFYGTHGGVVWDSSSGGTSLLWEQGLSEDEMRAVAQQLDAGTVTLPQGLVSVGISDVTDIAMASKSYCYDRQGHSATITEIRGNQASRYREAFFTAPASARRFDQGDATIVIDGGGVGSFDITNATYHEATPEEWEAICLGAGSSCDARTPASTTTP
jgi:hypothetical protein